MSCGITEILQHNIARHAVTLSLFGPTRAAAPATSLCRRLTCGATRTRAIVYYLIYPRYRLPVLSRGTYYIIIIHNVARSPLLYYSPYPSRAFIIYSCFVSINRLFAPHPTPGVPPRTPDQPRVPCPVPQRLSSRPAKSRRPFNPRVELLRRLICPSSTRIPSFFRKRAPFARRTFDYSEDAPFRRLTATRYAAARLFRYCVAPAPVCVTLLY